VTLHRDLTAAAAATEVTGLLAPLASTSASSQGLNIHMQLLETG